MDASATKPRPSARGARSRARRALPLAKVYTLIEPGPVVLLATSRRGRPNVMPMSWLTMLEFEPPLIGCVIGGGHLSHANLLATRQCVIAIPTAELVDAVVRSGNCSGREVADKFEASGLTPVAASLIEAPLIAECYANLECRVVDRITRYGMFVLEMQKAWIDPACRQPRTLHHRGYGSFMVAGPEIRRASKMA